MSSYLFSFQHRGSQVLEIQNFNHASLDDVARVHSRSYITGLEKVLVIKLSLFILTFSDKKLFFSTGENLSDRFEIMLQFA